MKKLNLIDRLFYELEERGVSLVMQGVLVLNPGGGKQAPDGAALAEHLMVRLQGVDLLRQKVVRDPLGIGDLRWVEDSRFDIRNHITRATLHAPGDDVALTAHLEAFSTQELVVGRPLWRFEVIDGLAGNRLAIGMKIHHCMVDGVGSTQMLNGLYDTECKSPEKLFATLSRPAPREPSRLNLSMRGVRDAASRAFAVPGFLTRHAGDLVGVITQSLGNSKSADRTAETRPKAPKTSLNTRLSKDQRAVDFRRFDIGELKDLARTLNCTLNDLAFLLCSAAMTDYFAAIGEEVQDDLIAAMPMNVRKDTDTAAGNIVGISTVNLHTTMPNLIERLKAIHSESEMAKARVRGQGGNTITLDEIQAVIPPPLVAGLAALIPRLTSWDAVSDRLVFANAAISNVPGPREPRYIGGAEIEFSIPMIPMTDTQTLSWGVTSFGDWLTIAFHACGVALRDKNLLIQGLDKAYEDLRSHLTPVPRVGPKQTGGRMKPPSSH